MSLSRVRVGVLACALACAGALALAQVRAVPEPLPAGTAKLSGVVVNQDGAVMARATVTITDERGRATAVMTDDTGAFAFATLPAGTFELVARMPDFLPAYYGQLKPGRAGVPLTIADGQTLRDVRLTLARAGVVAGTVTDPSGQPAYGALVRLFQRRFRADGPWLAPVLNLPPTVDDLGQYRIHGVLPGEYIVTASPRSDQMVTPGAERLVSTSFPGVAQADQATLVTLAPGEQRLGTDIRLLQVPRLKISGRVVGVRGPGFVWIDLSTELSGLVSSRGTDNEGRFEISDLAPSRYRLGASDVAPKEGVTAGRDRQWAATEVTLGSTDVSDVTLVLARGASISGRVVVERTGRAPQDARAPTTLRLFPLYSSVILHGLDELNCTIDAAGRFTIPAVPPGRYSIAAWGQSTWRNKSAMLDGRDVFDTFLDVSSDVDNLVITVTDSPTEISGHLLNAPRSLSAYTVIAFPAERQLPNSLARRVVAGTLLSSGGFVLASLPAGKYLLAVLEDAEQGSWYDPKLLEALRPTAIPVTVTDGQKVVQDLRVR